MPVRDPKTTPKPKAVRCLTRALKNAQHLKKHAPDLFEKDSPEGFGTGIPIEILRALHRLRPDSPVLNRHPKLVDFLRKNRLPVPTRASRDALFSGTVHFAQVTFQTSSGNLVMSTADMNTIVQYAQHASIAISEYAAQYGPNRVSVSPTLIQKTVSVPSANFSDGDLQGWVNQMATDNGLGSNDCIFVIVPQGISANEVGGNSGYHSLANIPYIVAGVFATGLTLQDVPDVYAMVVSHEMAEMVVDPKVDGQNPEVCDPCDINCSNLTRIYFDNSDNFIGVNQNTPPSGFTFAYYICAVVKPDGASACPASAADCQYAPVIQDCELIIDKSTYGKDEVDLQLPGTASFGSALWVAVDGFVASELGFQQTSDLNNPNPNPLPTISIALDPLLNGGLTANQLTQIGQNLPTVAFGPSPVVATDPTLQAEPQRLLYPFTVSFTSDAAFNALQSDQSAVLTLTATFTVGQITRTASANIELVPGQNPYFTDVDPLNPSQPSWLSFDLRLFKVAVPSGQSATRFGASVSSAADAHTFIANAISNLTQNGGNVSGDTFDGLTQNEDASALEFLQSDNNGNAVFNFAVARVRLKGKTAGAQATAVRVFFRMFQAQSTSSEFNTSTSYRFASDGVLNGHTIALLGVQNDAQNKPEYVTIPCFATKRINLNSPLDMSGQLDPPNVQTITVNPGAEVDTFFGCWLDINQPQQKFLPQTPDPNHLDGNWSTNSLISINEAITRAPHQCLIAEIRYDDTPIPPGATSATSDKLAQRNIAWIDGPNPGAIDSRRMPHPFEIRATPAQNQMVDELMITWGNTPEGSSASLYLPSLNASDILALADSMYSAHQLTAADAHTIQCPAGSDGVTFVPIPKGTLRNAGLLTVDLPPGIKKGQIFNILVRQLTESSYTPIIIQRGNRDHKADPPTGPYSWRSMVGAFAINIVISTKEQLLHPEERLLAWMLWIQKSVPATNRWYPVLQRYIAQIIGRVTGFGGNPGQIGPSPTGTVPHPKPHPHPHPHPEPGKCEILCRKFTGKVTGILHDRFGDFEGFILLTECGDEHRFCGREHQIEHLVRTAWEQRAVISVFVDHHRPQIPVSILLRRAPEPFQH